MLRDELLFRVASSASARNVLVGYAANRPSVVFRPTKVLPSACESVLALAVHLATAETYTSIPKFQSSRSADNYDSQSRINSAGTFEIRDAVFQELIRMSSASNYREELVTRAGGLLSLGLLEEQATKVATVFVPH